ncbi:MAG: RecX family transcriptional regulator [Leptotrichiaceae bacterium]|nr:RecX family transcriptional regulator [Leptotrichiaceae bacterium]MBP6281507.1 RecX family transcriptional regulator [Leptotrichiaceae bacterium]MBP7100829.1 RecX family transcriptional regulator [Leptotrichiaceae bacterium]MBP7725463.1 RecX family transcriptional regulator [Leptotrichiaceae bacterium]MBP9628886.1 RecX family transcriptional regulator [Leptotrichiaceae bacterium]
MIIEKIQKNKIYLSTEEILDISPLIKQRYNLKVNENIESLYDDISYEASIEKGIFLLSLKDRTKKELFLKLKEKYRNMRMVEKAVLKLEELGYINDFNYATLYIKSKKYGKKKVFYSLFQKGLSKEIIEDAFIYVEENEREENIKSFEEEKLEKLILKNLKKDEKKLIQYLIRQGFELNEILRKMKEFNKNSRFFDLEGE